MKTSTYFLATVDTLKLHHAHLTQIMACPPQVLQKKPIHYVKIDVEGHEGYIFQGATQLLKEAPPKFIMVEYYPAMLTFKGVSTTKFMKTIYDAGYRVFDCQTQGEIKANDDDSDSLLATYARNNAATDLLLVRKIDYPASTRLPAFSCGY